MKYAKSGGKATLEEHRRLGADLDIDIPYQWLRFFLEDDNKLKDIEENYKAGRMTTTEVKQILIECISNFLTDFQARRAAVTDEVVAEFMSERRIDIMPDRFKPE